MHKHILYTLGYAITASMLLLLLAWRINGTHSPHSTRYEIRAKLLDTVYIAAPATAPAGRNIAFETGNAVSNAPASYLTMLDCCESDEAIADRIAVGQTTCRIIRRR